MYNLDTLLFLLRRSKQNAVLSPFTIYKIKVADSDKCLDEVGNNICVLDAELTRVDEEG